MLLFLQLKISHLFISHLKNLNQFKFIKSTCFNNFLFRCNLYLRSFVITFVVYIFSLKFWRNVHKYTKKNLLPATPVCLILYNCIYTTVKQQKYFLLLWHVPLCHQLIYHHFNNICHMSLKSANLQLPNRRNPLNSSPATCLRFCDVIITARGSCYMPYSDFD